MNSGEVIAGKYLIVKGPAEDRTLKGGMGVVYQCFDGVKKRVVAVKTFDRRLLANHAVRDRFLHEAEFWIRLGRHANIVRAYEVERVDHTQDVYVVAEWVAAAEGKRGASLREWLRSGRPLPNDQALGWALGIARAMNHASAVVPGLVHRDLKPENVLIGRDGHARVTDFGLAQAVFDARASLAATEADDSREAPDAQHTRVTADWVGTPAYMAPEQWDGGKVDSRADVYALGAVLVEMLTGTPAVRTPNLVECRAQHRAGRAFAAAQGLAPDILEFLAGCLAPQAGDRHATWEEVEAALQMVHERVTGRPAASPPALAQQTREERTAEGWSINAIGSSYLDLGKYPAAARFFEQSVRTAQDEGDRILEWTALANLGTAWQYGGDLRRAVDLLERALTIVREVGQPATEAQLLGNLANAYGSLGDTQRAMDLLQKRLKFARDAGDRRAEGHSLDTLGNLYAMVGDRAAAARSYEQAIAIARELGDRVGLRSAMGNLGNIYRHLGNGRAALDCHEKELAMAREDGDRASEGQALAKVGLVYKSLGDLQRAVDCYEQHLLIAREVGDRVGEGKTLANLGSAYGAQGELQRALHCFERALAITQEVGDRPFEALTRLNLAMLSAQYQQWATARQHAEVARRLFREIGHAEYAARAEGLLKELESLPR